MPEWACPDISHLPNDLILGQLFWIKKHILLDTLNNVYMQRLHASLTSYSCS